MDLQLLREANQTLSKCGRPQMPVGLVSVPLYKGILMQFFFPANPAQTTQTITKEIAPPSKAKVMPRSWSLRSIQMSQPAEVAIQIQLPDGRFLLNNPIQINQIAGYGSARFPFTEPTEYPIGSKLQVTLNNTNVATMQSLALLFDGSYNYYLQGAQETTIEDGGCAPRYFGDPSQNILAPSWMTGKYPRALPGCVDLEMFTYASDVLTLGEDGFGTATIQIDQATDFAVRRRFFSVIWSDTVTAATVQVRTRNGSGYALDDDFLNTHYIANSPMPHDWNLAAAEQVFFDLSVVDFEGSGILTVQCFLEGVKRGKR